MNFLKWLYPGMKVKRWLLLLMIGVGIIGLGFAYILREAYNYYTFPNFVWYITLQFLPRYVRGALFLGAGVGLIMLAVWQFNRSLLLALWPQGRNGRLLDTVFYQRYLRRGPKVVALGGGTGLSTLLRGVKEYTGNLTAIVTVADDGGSSGRLRRELGVLPPGDFRNCIAALADAEPLMAELFQYRFGDGSGLAGHSFGNLFIVAMSEVTGNFEEAVRESSRVLAVRGQILPSTLANVTLSARVEGEAMIRGESNITSSGNRIRQIYLEPADVQAHPEAVQALLDADLIILGPGSLYTSVMPNLLVTGIREAIRLSSALKVYVCNVATQPGETDGFSVADHVEALVRHVGPGLFDCVLANSNINTPPSAQEHADMVRPEVGTLKDLPVILADVVSESSALRHDPKKLGASLVRLYTQWGRRSPLQVRSNGL
ncbi:MAG: YvcK family protein [Chloroflexi bacterium]|nr:YvcK family protein [Chloroflexota bacterium]